VCFYKKLILFFLLNIINFRRKSENMAATAAAPVADAAAADATDAPTAADATDAPTDATDAPTAADATDAPTAAAAADATDDTDDTDDTDAAAADDVAGTSVRGKDVLHFLFTILSIMSGTTYSGNGYDVIYYLSECAVGLANFIKKSDYLPILKDFHSVEDAWTYLVPGDFTTMDDLDRALWSIPDDLLQRLIKKMMEKADVDTKVIVWGLIECPNPKWAPQMTVFSGNDFFPKDFKEYCGKFGLNTKDFYRIPDTMKNGFNPIRHNDWHYQKSYFENTIRYVMDY